MDSDFSKAILNGSRICLSKANTLLNCYFDLIPVYMEAVKGSGFGEVRCAALTSYLKSGTWKVYPVAGNPKTYTILPVDENDVKLNELDVFNRLVQMLSSTNGDFTSNDMMAFMTKNADNAIPTICASIPNDVKLCKD